MCKRKFYSQSVAFTFIVLAANLAWGLGFRLSETKEQLKLKYDVSLVDHGNDRVSVTLTILDQGRLEPLDSVDFVIPSQDGTGFVDLVVSLATKKVDGKLSAQIELKKELAERAEIQLKTWSLDSKIEKRTWYYHSIPIAEYLKKQKQKKE
jgi:hypothetical protein